MIGLLLVMTQVFSQMKPGLDLSVGFLTVHARYQLAKLLDPSDDDTAEGRDWRGLASSVGFTDRLASLTDQRDTDASPLSRFEALLDAWSNESDATIRDLHGELVKLGRTDAVETLLSLAPLFRYDF